jgi:hypothetical protein
MLICLWAKLASSYFEANNLGFQNGSNKICTMKINVYQQLSIKMGFPKCNTNLYETCKSKLHV